MARRITSIEFATRYVPMAKAGKTALEIARALGLDGDDKSDSHYVTLKACQLRKSIKVKALTKANELNLEGEDRDKFLTEMENKVPKLTSRTGKSKIDDVILFIDGLLERLDAPTVEIKLVEKPVAEIVEPVVEPVAEIVEPVVEPEAPKRQRRSRKKA